MGDGTLPVGFGMALAQNETAMRKYEALTEAEKKALMDQIHGVQSKSEMRQLVAELADRPDANEERPIPAGVYPVIDTDLARDNVENDIPAADRQDLS